MVYKHQTKVLRGQELLVECNLVLEQCMGAGARLRSFQRRVILAMKRGNIRIGMLLTCVLINNMIRTVIHTLLSYSLTLSH